MDQAIARRHEVSAAEITARRDRLDRRTSTIARTGARIPMRAALHSHAIITLEVAIFVRALRKIPVEPKQQQSADLRA